MDTRNHTTHQNRKKRFRSKNSRNKSIRQENSISKREGLQKIAPQSVSKRSHSYHKKHVNNPNVISRRTGYNDTVYKTANATNWNNSSDYIFKNYSGPKVRIIPISGVEMVGTNCTLIEYEDDILIIDAGLGFPEFDLTGVDALVPNLSYVYNKLDKIRGIIITHGHTDHIGGLHYIYDKIGFPQIFAPKLASEMIREKFKETGFGDKLKITEINGESSYYLGKFHISHFKMNHTIMDNYGIVIDTPVGRIVTPSDYKFDLTPYKESPSDYSKLAKLGDEGVLLLLDESTNVRNRGWAPSETVIAYDLENVIRDAHGRLIIGMFSTMISRIRQIMELSIKYGKKIAIFGRSLETNINIAMKLGYIDAKLNSIIRQEEIDNYADDSIVILTTGSQGEPSAALMRMALGEHSKIKLKKSDTVVFSSSRIPGNEAKIDRLINKIADKGCRILTNDHLTLHASGHGHQEDHKLMWQLTKPKFIMPIHGEPAMLNANKELAMSMGYKENQIIMTRDGSVIELWNEGWSQVGNIDSEPLWVEGNRVGDFDMQIIHDRKLMTDEGVIVLSIKNYNAKYIDISDIELITKGFFIQNKDDFTTRVLPQIIIEQVNRMNPNRDKETMRSGLKKIIENEIYKMYEKKPLIIVSVL